MYTNSQAGQAAARTAAPTSNAYYLGTLRRNILAAIINNPDFTAEEQLRCNDSVHQCASAPKLAVWLKNVRRVAAEREEARQLELLAQGLERGRELVSGPSKYATAAQCDEVFAVACHPALLPCEKSQALGKLPTLTYAGAVRLLGKLYAKVLHRTGQRLGHNDGSTQLAA